MKKGIIGTILTIIVIFLIYFVVKDIDFFEVYLILRKINPVYVLLAFFSSLFSFLLWNLRLKNSLKEIIPINYIKLLPFLFTGLFVNMITPGSGIIGGGEPVRAYFLGKKYKKSKTKVLGCILADKFFNLSVFVSFVILSLLFVIIYLNIPENTKLTLEIILFFIFLIVSFIVYFIWKKIKLDMSWFIKRMYKFRYIKKRFSNFSKFEKYAKKRIKNLTTLFKKVITNKKSFYFGILISVLMWVFNYFVSYFLFLAFGFHVNFISVAIVVSLGYFIGDISLVPGGIGLIEGTMFLLYSAMGVLGPLAITVALFSRIIYYFFTIFLGGLALVYLRYKIK